MAHISDHDAQVLDINITNIQSCSWKNLTCYKINLSDEKQLSIKFLSKVRCIYSWLDVYNAIIVDDKFETF